MEFEKIKSTILTILLSAFALLDARAVEKQDTTSIGLIDKGVHLAEKILDLISYESKSYSVAVYPVLGYSYRTGVEVGLMPIIKFNNSKTENNEFYRPSTIAPSFQVSTKGMYEADIDVVVFTKNNWSFNSKIKFLYLPDTFYGLGNDTKKGPFTSFDSYKYSATGEILKGISSKLFAGVQWDLGYYENRSIKNPTDNNSVWLTSAITGAYGGWSNGIGPIIRFDSRNNIVFPTKGWLITASYLNHNKITGSEYNFGYTTIDVRNYIPAGANKQVVALQGYINSTHGNTPFFKLATPAGKRLMRGIGHPYKYLDKNAWLLQAEYRRSLWWRIGGVAFAGGGNAFNSFSGAITDKMHIMGGLGLRFRALPKEHLNIRLDAGMTNRGDHAIFFTLREAF